MVYLFPQRRTTPAQPGEQQREAQVFAFDSFRGSRASRRRPPAARPVTAGLTPEATRLMQTASLLGPTFSARALACVAHVPASAIVGAIAEVVDAGVVVEAGDELAFPCESIRVAFEAA